MADMRFFMGNMVLIIGLALAFGQFGLADMLDQDVVIGDADELVADGEVNDYSDVDFDTDRLNFDIGYDDWVVNPNTGYQWTGQDNDRDESYGYVSYNVSELDQFSLVHESENLAFTGTEVYYQYEGEDTWEKQVSHLAKGQQRVEIDDVDFVEFRLTSQKSYLVDINTQLDAADDQLNSSQVEERDLDIEDSAFEQIRSAVATGTNLISQVPSIFSAWIEFSLAIPGVAGDFFRMYIGAFIAYIAVRWIWIG